MRLKNGSIKIDNGVTEILKNLELASATLTSSSNEESINSLKTLMAKNTETINTLKEGNTKLATAYNKYGLKGVTYDSLIESKNKTLYDLKFQYENMYASNALMITLLEKNNEALTETLKTMEALLIISPGKKNIVLDKDRARNVKRDRFTIAHEIGHYLMPWHDTLQQWDNTINFDLDDKIEQEANDFASELLVPEEYLLQDIKDKKLTLDLIKSLSEKYNVSLVVMARRILKYSQVEAIALIYYSNGKKYVQMKSSVFKGELKEGMIKDSSAHKLIKTYNSSAETKEILDYDVWFKQNIDNYKVVEESIYQSKLGRVFTLIRKADFEDELDLNWDF